jgi:hypothetical protein
MYDGPYSLAVAQLAESTARRRYHAAYDAMRRIVLQSHLARPDTVHGRMEWYVAHPDNVPPAVQKRLVTLVDALQVLEQCTAELRRCQRCREVMVWAV